MRILRAVAASTLALPLAVGSAVPAQAAGRGVVDVPVSFVVHNLDRTALGAQEQQTCPADPGTEGTAWTVRGRLVAGQGVLQMQHRSVTVYVHGLAVSGESAFHFDAVPGYDLAREEAEHGHASLVIDRIGYGDSTRPDGADVCTGAGADVLHQVVQQLRQGGYGGPSFGRVTLAGWSAGGLLAEVEAYTFQDVDGLVVLAYEDQGFTPFLFGELGKHAERCAAGTPDGYAWTFNDLDDPAEPHDSTRQAMFSAGSDAAVVAAVLRDHEPDPCGENAVPYIVTNPAALGSVTVPVLLVYGESDPLFDASQAPVQASHFGSSDTTVVVLPDTGHLLMLEPSAPVLRADISRWLRSHHL